MTIFEFAAIMEELCIILEKEITLLHLEKNWEYVVNKPSSFAFGKGNEQHYIQLTLSSDGSVVELQERYMTLSPIVSKVGKKVLQHITDTMYSFFETKQLPVWIRSDKQFITYHPRILELEKLMHEYSGKFFISEEFTPSYFTENFIVQANTDLFSLDVYYEKKEPSHLYKRLRTIEQVQAFKKEIFESEMKHFEDEILVEAKEKELVSFHEEHGWIYRNSFLNPEVVQLGIEKQWEHTNWKYGIEINKEYTKTLEETNKKTALKHIENHNENLKFLRNMFDVFLTMDPKSYIVHDNRPHLILFGEKYSFVVTNENNHFSLYLSSTEDGKEYDFDEVGTQEELLISFAAFVKKTFSPIRMERLFNNLGDPNTLFIVYSLGLNKHYKKITWEFEEGLEKEKVFQEIEHLFGNDDTISVFPKNTLGSVLTSSYQIIRRSEEFISSKTGAIKRKETLFAKTKEA